MLRRATHRRGWSGWILATIMLASLIGSSPAKAGGLNNGFGIMNGIYAAEGFGSNYYFGARYNHYFNRYRYFVEGNVGFSSLKSQVLEDLAAFQVFQSEGLFTYEFLLGYDVRPLSGLPYVVMGVAGVSQGGQSKFAYVLGIGKLIPLAQFFDVKRFGIRYDIRDHIFKQQINEDNSFTAHNLVFSVGLQYYF